MLFTINVIRMAGSVMVHVHSDAIYHPDELNDTLPESHIKVCKILVAITKHLLRRYILYPQYFVNAASKFLLGRCKQQIYGMNLAQNIVIIHCKTALPFGYFMICWRFSVGFPPST